MNSVIFLLAIAFSSTSVFAADALKYGPTAIRLFLQHDYIQKNKSPDYWALSPYYVAQRNVVSCTVASAAMVLNAGRASKKLTASEALYTQEFLIKTMNIDYWTKRTTAPTTLENINYSDYGVSLSQLEEILKQSFKKLKFEKAKVEIIYADGSKKNKQRIIETLKKNEKSSDNFIIANFLQSIYTGDPEGALGHVAPVAAFDEKRELVLIMDPDREYYEPYWVSIKTFIAGLEEKDFDGKSRGILFVSF